MIELKQATPGETLAFHDIYVATFTHDKLASGEYQSEDDAIAYARKIVADPASTINCEQYYWIAISVEGVPEPVGLIWLLMDQTAKGLKSWVEQLFIKPEYRRNGYAKEAMAALEDWVSSLGSSYIGLGVLVDNHAARGLYASLGYKVVDYSPPNGLHKLMEKSLAL